jgi:hypothetical protein
MTFLQSFIDKADHDIQQVEVEHPRFDFARDSA